MCMGRPMQVLADADYVARCQSPYGEENVDMSLVGAVTAGEWVLVFAGAAREKLTPTRAAEIEAALAAVEAALQGRFDPSAHFADLIGREPTLPAHLHKGTS